MITGWADSMRARLLLAGVAFGALACSDAQASELERVANSIYPEQSDRGWSGFYLGAATGVTADKTDYFVTAPVGNTFVSSPGEFTDTGIIGGLYAGYDFDLGDFVIGFEGDIAALGGISQEDYFFGAKTDETISESIDWLATLRARAGYGSDQYLVYLTGGLTAGHVNADYNYSNTVITTFSYDGSASGFEFGWVLGAGIETRLDSRWSVRAEFMHVDLNDTTLSAFNAFNGVTNTVRFENELDIARVGLTFRY